MDAFDYVIVGGGPAGLSAIESIRRVDSKGSLLWVSDEVYLPYSKVLLPYLLSGKVDESKLALINQQKLEELKVKFWPGSPVLSLNAETRVLGLESGKEVIFGKLLIASGASPSFPEIKGIETKGVLGLRKLNDISNIKKWVKKGGNVVIWGGGLVGTQAANALFLKGVPSSLVVSSSHILSQILDHASAKFIQKKIEKQGSHLYFKEDISEIRSMGGRVSSVILRSGKELKADLVIVGKGVRPNTEFLTGSKIDLDKGVLVDQRMATSIPDIYAAGDVAVGFDLLSRGRSRSAIWPKAIEQGWVAGKNMVGEDMIYPGTLNMNITTIYGTTIAAVGETQSINCQGEILTFRDKKAFRRVFLREGKIIGAVLIGNNSDVGVLSCLIRSRISLNRMTKEYNGEPISFNQIYEEIFGQL